MKDIDITNASIAIAGAGPLAQTIACLLVQSKVKRLYIASEDDMSVNKYEPLLFKTGLDEPKVKNVADNLIQISKGIHGSLASEIYPKPYKIKDALGSSTIDLIIDATNDAGSKQITDALAKARGIPALFCSASLKSALYTSSLGAEQDWEPFQDKVQGPITSGLVGGYAVLQIESVLSGERLVGKQQYNLPVTNSEQEIIDKLKGKKILAVGAGAVGNITGSVWALLGADLAIVDYDLIESRNLVHQYFYHRAENEETIGKPKVSVFSRRLENLIRNADPASKNTIKPINTKITNADQIAELAADYDLVCLSVDNDKTRNIVSDYLVREKKEGHEASIGPTGGQVVVYSPSKTAMCIYHTGRHADMSGGCYASGMQTIARVMGSLSIGEGLACLLKQPLCNALVRYEQAGGFGITEISADACPCVQGIEVGKDTIDKALKLRGFSPTNAFYTYKTRRHSVKVVGQVEKDYSAERTKYL